MAGSGAGGVGSASPDSLLPLRMTTWRGLVDGGCDKERDRPLGRSSMDIIARVC